MVGAHCEALWLKAGEAQALARYERDPKIKMIRQEQARADLIPKTSRGRKMNPEITEGIDDITGGSRFTSIPLKRPYGVKEEIIAAAIAWCGDEYGQIISESKAAECWKKYKRFQKQAKDRRSLNST